MEIPRQTAPVVIGDASLQAAQAGLKVGTLLCCRCTCIFNICVCRCRPCGIVIYCW